MEITAASKIKFCDLTVLLSRISNKKGTEEKKSILKSFISSWREFEQTLLKDAPNSTGSFFPVMRLLLPQHERDRDAYGIKEVTLAKLYIDIHGLGKTSTDAQKLINFRAPKAVKGDAGDFASVAYFVLKSGSRCPEKSTMTIEEVNDCLDGIASSNALGNKEGKRQNLQTLMRKLTAKDQMWLIRIIMKELKIGLSQQSIFSVFHQDAEDLFNVKMSLKEVCRMLKDPNIRMHEIEVTLFSPFRPMLGDRGAPNKAEKDMKNKPFLIETKFDGERMQCHKQGGRYKYFSRGGNDYTTTYGDTEFSGNFTRHISQCFAPHVKSCILDGEMVGFNPITGVRGSKGENFDIKSVNEKEYQPMMCVFDILMLNGDVLSNKPLRVRKEILSGAIKDVPGRMMISSYSEGISNQDCADALNIAIDNREEGIMIKDPESVYKPNTRKGGWYKVKPEYVGGMMDELDLLVIGGYFGKGSRASNNSDKPLLTHFLCAVAKTPPDNGKPEEFHSFCKVGSGYSHKELQQFNLKISSSIQQYDKNRLPPMYILASGNKQRPDFWIQPEKSVIVQVKAAEITSSSQFATGCTLRFPRVEKIRYDKNYYDCMTITELEDINKKSEGKLAGRYALAHDEDDEPQKKRRKTMKSTAMFKPTVAARFKAADLTRVTKISEVFLDKEFCIMNGTTSHPKSALEEIVAEFGGSVVQNPGLDTFCVVAGNINLKVKNTIRKGIYDVIWASWLINCHKEKKFIPWKPSDMHHTSPKTMEMFDQDFDIYGDCYTEDCSYESLKKVFERVGNKENSKLDAEYMADIEMKHFPQDSLLGLFRLCRVYIDMNTVIGDKATHVDGNSLELMALDMRYHGATIFEDLVDNVSHVIIDSRNLEKLSQFKELNKERCRKFHIVTEKWVSDCIEKGKIVSERSYEF